MSPSILHREEVGFAADEYHHLSSQISKMIIKGFLRRYKRWNPVHPTFGAFWGMGVGLGCGVGWGPGFGPEVIGYVGAGCGVGFSVGFTFAGFGIGLPTNFLFGRPYSVIVAARKIAGQPGDVSRGNVRASGWSIVPNASVLHSEAMRRLSWFRGKNFLEASSNLFDSKAISWRSESIWKGLSEFGDRVFNPHRGNLFYKVQNSVHYLLRIVWVQRIDELVYAGIHLGRATVPAELKGEYCCIVWKSEVEDFRAQGSEFMTLTAGDEEEERLLFGHILWKFSNHVHSLPNNSFTPV